MTVFYIYDTNGQLVGNPEGYKRQRDAWRIAFHNKKVNAALYAAYNIKRQSALDCTTVTLFTIKG